MIFVGGSQTARKFYRARENEAPTTVRANLKIVELGFQGHIRCATVIVLPHRSLNRRGIAAPRCRRAIVVIARHIAASRQQTRIVA
jgi:hypothetical protein